MLTGCARAAALLGLAGLLAGCVSDGGQVGVGAGTPATGTLTVCHGFSCHFSTRLRLDRRDADTFARHFARASTPAAERDAISRAVQYFETRATRAIGRRDGPKSTSAQARRFGEMDCIDESQNTRSLLIYLAGRGLLRHHSVEQNASRGLLLDGRYFHSTAVVRDSAGRRWAVDSWYEPAGGPPDIMPLEEWRKRGVMGER